MAESSNVLLEKLLVAQVLGLAEHLKSAAGRDGTAGAGDYVREACALIVREQNRVLHLFLAAQSSSEA